MVPDTELLQSWGTRRKMGVRHRPSVNPSLGPGLKGHRIWGEFLTEGSQGHPLCPGPVTMVC